MNIYCFSSVGDVEEIKLNKHNFDQSLIGTMAIFYLFKHVSHN